ncbi:MAG: hypothetical protein ABI380_12075 [Edaphobacter sp.]
MQPSAKIRFIAVIGLTLSPLAPAQTSQTAKPPVTASQQTPHRADVTYTDGKLFVSANNSSLNQILRDIAQRTGMKITGGVTDERVFGQYGPAEPSKILGTLLDGTGSNMLLLQATSATPAELILTPRRGDPSPPNPNAAAFDEDTAPPPAAPQSPAAAQPAENAPGSPPAAQSSEPQSPNSVKTPQQIFEQLQRIRQQQQAPR